MKSFHTDVQKQDTQNTRRWVTDGGGCSEAATEQLGWQDRDKEGGGSEREVQACVDFTVW